MPKAEAGSAKAIGNAIKAKGLGRLRWYCQVCQKQCRDENGFKMHSQSEGHLRAMLVVGENAGKHIDDFSKQFQNEFLQLLSRRYNTKQTRANQVYQEYIQDKSHLHMNATRWVTLTEFVKHLGREGLVRAEENEKGWWISWVDNSPKALARQAESQKRERADMDDEQRQRKQLAEQIERAQRQAEEQARRDGVDDKEKGLVRDEGGPRVVLNLAPPPPPITTKNESGSPAAEQTAAPTTETTDTPAADSASPAPASTPAPVPAPAAAKPLSIINPLKRPPPSHNVFKQLSNKSTKTTSASDAATAQNLAKKQYLTAAEKLMLEDIERKRRVGSSGGGGPGGVGASRGIGYTGMGPTRGPARR
ncbi:hypothetical protein QFC21_002556 [Naganishia friedmannii]|uniref:Uncharacterized protein n=1 Tax=Naganishia friedmannii TaxID=89922 RepID=A0ACC2VUM1_9TREE|nr:hypothetical protein QFC21_002556 [Naganishia friedmannii]